MIWFLTYFFWQSLLTNEDRMKYNKIGMSKMDTPIRNSLILAFIMLINSNNIFCWNFLHDVFFLRLGIYFLFTSKFCIFHFLQGWVSWFAMARNFKMYILKTYDKEYLDTKGRIMYKWLKREWKCLGKFCTFLQKIF